MRGGMAGELHEGFSAAVAGGFGHHVTVGIGFAGERGQRGRDDQPGFRIKPAVQAPHPADRFGQVQMLRRPFAGGFVIGVLGGGGGEQFGGQRFELFDGQPGGMVGEEPFQVQCQVVAQAADRIRDDLRMIHPELARPATSSPVIGMVSESARPSRTRLPAQAPDSPRTGSSRTAIVDAAPSAVKAPVRSTRSISRHVKSSP